MRYYFRRRGSKAMPLPGLPGSEEFMAAYAAALAGLPHVEIGASRTLPGTINALAGQLLRFGRVAEARGRHSEEPPAA